MTQHQRMTNRNRQAYQDVRQPIKKKPSQRPIEDDFSDEEDDFSGYEEYDEDIPEQETRLYSAMQQQRVQKQRARVPSRARDPWQQQNQPRREIIPPDQRRSSNSPVQRTQQRKPVPEQRMPVPVYHQQEYEEVEYVEAEVISESQYQRQYQRQAKEPYNIIYEHPFFFYTREWFYKIGVIAVVFGGVFRFCKYIGWLHIWLPTMFH